MTRTTLEKIREKYPVYSDRSDEELATALHKKYTSETGQKVDFDAFSEKIGFNKATWGGVAASIPGQAEGGALQGMGGIMQAMGESASEGFLPDKARTVGEIFEPDLTDPFEAAKYPFKVAGRLAQSAAELFNQRPVHEAVKSASEPLKEIGKSFFDQGKKKIEKARPKNMSFWQEAASTAGVSMGTMIPAAAAGFVFKSPSFVAASFGAQEFGRSFGDAKDEGLDNQKAFQHAWLSGMVEAGTEFLPAKFLFKKDKNLAKRFANFMAAELTGENIAELTQMFSERNHGLRDEETMDDVIETMKLTSAATLLGGSTQMTTVKVVEEMIDKAEKRAIKRSEKEKSTELDDIASLDEQEIEVAADAFIEEAPDLDAFYEEVTAETKEQRDAQGAQEAEQGDVAPADPTASDGLPMGAIASVMRQESKKGLPDGQSERRSDPLRDRIKSGKATIEEIDQAVYTDPGTNLHNRRAYDEAKLHSPKPFEAAVDGDSLKWVNDNLGHETGDKLLKLWSKELKKQFGGDVYRIGGDEFNVLADDETQLRDALKRTAKALKSAKITVKKPDGTMVELEGLGLTYGIGRDNNEADAKLYEEKTRRTEAGQRAKTGGKPPGVAYVGRSDTKGADTEGQQDSVSKDVKKDDTGPGTLHSNPVVAVYKSYQGMAQKAYNRVRDAYGWKLAPLGRLKAKALYLKDRYLALGKVAQAEDISKKVNELFTPLGAEQAAAAYDFLTTKNADPSTLTTSVRKRAVAIKKLIQRVGKELVARGMISKESFDKHDDAYLPRVYLKHLLGNNAQRGFSGGKKPSSLGYTKERADIPKDIRELVLGEITDPGYLASKTLGTTLRDIAVLDWFEKIAANKDWTLQDALVNYKGRKASVFWLEQEAERIRKQIPYYTPVNKAKAEAIVRQIDAIVTPAMEKLGQPTNTEGYKQAPNTARYGRLRGTYIKTEIYNDIVGIPSYRDPDAKWWEAPFEYGGIGTKITQLWKMSKVALNPPTQVRNFISNGILLQMSGVGTHRVVPLLVKSIGQVKNNGKYWRIAKKYGITATTFTNQELIDLETEFNRLQKTGKINIAAQPVLKVLAKIGKGASDLYGLSEGLWKTAKIMDAMEREGMSEANAVLEAQKWLYDYSLVPKTVRYFRNAPIGAPFLTFYYFTLPRFVETIMINPHRLAPYLAIPAALTAMISAEYDVEPEDVEKLKQALPEFLREHGHLFFLPYKDKHNRWVAFDFSYLLPWGMFSETMNKLGEGEVGEAIRSSGLIGGPAPDLIVAIKTNIDPFTKKPIANPGDPAAMQVASMTNYLWSMAMPSWMTERGAIVKMAHTATGRVHPRTGEPSLTWGQSIPRLAGLNFYPIEPEKSRRSNMFFLNSELRDIKTRMSQRLKDKNLSKQERKDIRAVFKALIKEKVRQIRDYQEASKIHPNLKTKKPNNGNGDKTELDNSLI